METSHYYPLCYRVRNQVTASYIDLHKQVGPLMQQRRESIRLNDNCLNIKLEEIWLIKANITSVRGLKKKKGNDSLLSTAFKNAGVNILTNSKPPSDSTCFCHHFQDESLPIIKVPLRSSHDQFEKRSQRSFN